MAKFQDIPQLTRDGSYGVDISLDYLEDYIDRMKREYKLTLDADFQRAHVWTRDQKIAFVEHLLRGGKGSNHIRMNYSGWMRFNDGDGPMVCVDGKQRLTACLDFVTDKIPCFRASL